MAAKAVHSRNGRGAAAQTLVWLALGFGLLAASVAALYFGSHNERLAAYASAPACSTFADVVAGTNCRYATTGRVTYVSGDGTITEVDLYVPGQEYRPFFFARLRASETSLGEGDQVQVEFWQTQVTKLDGAITADNPANDPQPGILLTIGLLLLPLGLGAAGWGLVRAWRGMRGQLGQATSTPNMNPVPTSDVLWH
jgi:hypothetical protein